MLHPPVNVPLGRNILHAVGFELRPLLRIMLRQISASAAIGFCRPARNTKVPDQVFAPFVLLFPGFQHGCHTVQRKRQAQLSRLHHRAVPTVRVQKFVLLQIRSGILPFQITGKADALELRIVCHTGRTGIEKGVQQFLWEWIAAGKVCNLNQAVIKGIGNEQNLKAV